MAAATKRYLGNTNDMVVHDLQNQHPNCQISEIRPENKRWFDSLAEALRAGYRKGKWCLGG